MSRKRRSFTSGYKVEAAHRVIDTGRTIAEVARELGINEALLGRWVVDERRTMDKGPAINRWPPPNAPSLLDSVSRSPSRRKTSIPEESVHVLCSESTNVECYSLIAAEYANFAIHFDGTTAQCLDLRLLQTPRTQSPNMIG